MQPDKQEECQEEGKVTTLEQDNNEEDKAIEKPVQQHDKQCVETTITEPTIKIISKQNNEPSIINNDTITEATKQNLDTSQPTAVQQPTVDPGLIYDDKESTSFQNLVNAVQRILPRSKDPTHPDHAAIKILKNMTRGCTKQFPLKDRQKFNIAQADFLPFNFNENGFVREPVSDSNFQSVQHKPTLKRKKVKMQDAETLHISYLFILYLFHIIYQLNHTKYAMPPGYGLNRKRYSSPVEGSIPDHSTVGRCESTSTVTRDSDPVVYDVPH